MTRPVLTLSRRAVIASAAALAACSRKPASSAKPPDAPTTIPLAVAGAWRSDADRARDKWRHPIESLTFWGLKPGQTVVEFWPGAGWYTDIIAPFLAATGGKLYAAELEPNDDASRAVIAAFKQKLALAPKLYGEVQVTAFGAQSGEVAPAGSADLVLFLRNLHNWMAAGVAEKAFRDAYAALKPGGVLGIEEHRAESGGVPDVLAADGYVQQPYVIKLAQEAGFRFDGASEINANPQDTKDHPFGVWTLPPVRRSSPRGETEDPSFDHSKYDAIGESDRMTLRFIKALTA